MSRLTGDISRASPILEETMPHADRGTHAAAAASDVINGEQRGCGLLLSTLPHVLPVLLGSLNVSQGCCRGGGRKAPQRFKGWPDDVLQEGELALRHIDLVPVAEGRHCKPLNSFPVALHTTHTLGMLNPLQTHACMRCIPPMLCSTACMSQSTPA